MVKSQPSICKYIIKSTKIYDIFPSSAKKQTTLQVDFQQNQVLDPNNIGLCKTISEK